MAAIAVVGTGGVGAALGGRLLAAKHQVTYGTRDPASDKVKALLAGQPGAKVALVQDAVQQAAVVLLATPGFTDRAGAEKAAQALGPGIKGKVLIDVTNPLGAYPALALTCTWTGTSASELLQELLPGTYVYKAFNTIGVEHLANPTIEGQPPLVMLMAGATEERSAAEKVVADVGFVPKYVGPIRYARNLEAIAELWIHTSAANMGLTPEDFGREFHFQLIGAK